MNVLMVDIASTSLPYDVGLAKGMLTDRNFKLYIAVHDKSNLILNKENCELLKLYKFCSLIGNFVDNIYILRVAKLIEHPFTMIRLVLFAFQVKPDVIHVQWTQFPMVDAFFYKILRKHFPLVYTVHNTTVAHGETDLLSRIQSSGINNFVKLFSKIVVHTKKSKEIFVKKYDFEPSNVHIVPHGPLDTKASSIQLKNKLLMKYGAGNSQEVIVLFGNINHYKGLDVFLNAFAKLSDDHKSKVKVIVAGVPRQSMHRYFDICQKHQLNQYISWDLGFIPEDALDALYSLATIFVLPYRHIDQSGVLMSIIKYGKPIIASSADGFSEILTHNKNALIFPIDDTNSLSEKLVELITSPKTKARLGSNIYSLYEKWPSWKEIASLHKKIYINLIE